LDQHGAAEEMKRSLYIYTYLKEELRAEAYELYVACKKKRKIKDDTRVLAQEKYHLHHRENLKCNTFGGI